MNNKKQKKRLADYLNKVKKKYYREIWQEIVNESDPYIERIIARTNEMIERRYEKQNQTVMEHAFKTPEKDKRISPWADFPWPEPFASETPPPEQRYPGLSHYYK